MCATCQWPYNPTPFIGTCYLCDDFNCQSCSIESPNICNNCNIGFIAAGGKCYQICSQPQCIICDPSSSSQCITCISSYFVNITNGQCLLCADAPKCTSCVPTNPTTCLSCSNGFYLNPSSSLCIACPSFCSRCTSATFCTQLT